MILVTGPESSGNRMLCRMLTEAGADVLHKPMPMSTHWRPGMPGNPDTWDGVWSDFASLEWDAAVVIVRDPICSLAAQITAGHVPDLAHATERTREALVRIFAQLGGSAKPWWLVTYEGLARPEAVTALCGLLDLDGSVVQTCWQDANAKYYGGQEWSDHTPLWEWSRGLSI